MNKALIGMPPGTILQGLYLRERIRLLRREGTLSTFIEFGAGNGWVSRILLEEGLTGIGMDLNESACANNAALNKTWIEQGRYSVQSVDFVRADLPKADVTISSMVIEHVPDEDLSAVFMKAKGLLNENGLIISLVPAGMQFWNVEDEIAGHIKRYRRVDFEVLARQEGLRIAHLAGLTFPLSNLLFRLSNRLVAKHEGGRLRLSQHQKTEKSGNRNVPFKTTFPRWLNFAPTTVA